MIDQMACVVNPVAPLVTPPRRVEQAIHDLADRFSLITIEILPFFAVEALGDFGVNGKGFGHGVESSGKAQKYPLDCPV